MSRSNKKLDLFFLVLVVAVLVGLPFGIVYYDRQISSRKNTFERQGIYADRPCGKGLDNGEDSGL